MRKPRTANQDCNDSAFEEVIILAKPVDPQERIGGMRLNAEMKKEIVANAIEHAFGKQYKALEDEARAIGTAAYRKCVTPTAIKHALALGEPWVSVGKDHYGRKTEIPTVQFCLDGQYHNLPVPAKLPVPRSLTHDERKLFRVNDSELAERNRQLIGARETLTEKRNKVQQTLEAMLARITTYPSLEKNWPAGLPFYKHLPKKYPFRHQVPAVLVDELNAALGV